MKETPLTKAVNLSTRLGVDIWLKREDAQEVFSFKIRGAYNFMSSLNEEEKWKGVVTCSAGEFFGSAILRRREGKEREVKEESKLTDPNSLPSSSSSSSSVPKETTPKESLSPATSSVSHAPSSCLSPRPPSNGSTSNV